MLLSKQTPISISFASQHIMLVTDVSELFQCPCPNIKCALNDTHEYIYSSSHIFIDPQKIVPLDNYISTQY